MSGGQPRRAAQLAGQPRYFTGVPCVHGHTAERATASGKCVVCSPPGPGRPRGRSPRTAAMLRDEATYSTGAPCKNGHTGRRYTSTGACLTCQRLGNAAHNARRGRLPKQPAPPSTE